jgi:hypothetical protein
MITPLKNSVKISVLVATIIISSNAQTFEGPLKVDNERQSYTQQANLITQTFKELNKEAEEILANISVYEKAYEKAYAEVKTIRNVLDAIEEMMKENIAYDERCQKSANNFRKDTLLEVDTYKKDPYLTDEIRSEIDENSKLAIRTAFDNCISTSSKMSSRDIELKNDVIKIYRSAVKSASGIKVEYAKLVAMRETVVTLGKKYNIASAKMH